MLSNLPWYWQVYDPGDVKTAGSYLVGVVWEEVEVAVNRFELKQ